MTRDVIAVMEMTGIGEVAELFAIGGIKRVPVMRDAKIVGIISRANLVRMLAKRSNPLTETESDDLTVRRSLLAELPSQKWGRDSTRISSFRIKSYISLPVEGSAELRAALCIAEANTPGVRGGEVHVS